MTAVAVITTVHGRLDHLSGMRRGLARQGVDLEHVVVRMGGPEPWDACREGPSVVRVDLEMPSGPDRGRLPLAAARNAGAAATSADLLVFLDVDCIPASDLVRRYRAAAQRVSGLLAGPVAYLPPGVTSAASEAQLRAIARPHPARPTPASHELRSETRFELFWSLSFAMRRTEFDALDGFCADYVGYGGEDTDFAFRARAAAASFTWVGGALAWHQYHPVEDPPVGHLDDIVRNATVFFRRWGSWPMEGWLQAFAERGLVVWHPHGTVLRRIGADATA